MKTKVTSVNFDINNLNYIKQLSRIENRNFSNLVNEIIKEHYQKLPMKRKLKLLRIENIIVEEMEKK
ncbi:hypothetical protein [Aliarcobacter butzleri]|uniref:hypothetical protein n=1 Tax=Aliarcobacter butzleri TaxID=28197 RepID=UPI0021B64276|nr:hypothetical protein [Aliarcobacter butzleri]MCT7588228.1 hypothetical protein [Aliarcobacter butzleri]